MMTVTKEYIDDLMHGDNVFATIVNTPKPGLMEARKISKEFKGTGCP